MHLKILLQPLNAIDRLYHAKVAQQFQAIGQQLEQIGVIVHDQDGVVLASCGGHKPVLSFPLHTARNTACWAMPSPAFEGESVAREPAPISNEPRNLR